MSAGAEMHTIPAGQMNGDQTSEATGTLPANWGGAHEAECCSSVIDVHRTQLILQIAAGDVIGYVDIFGGIRAGARTCL